MTREQRKWSIRLAVAVLVTMAGLFTWQHFGNREKTPGLVSGNGRIEAVEIDIAARMAGRVKDVRVYEGESVMAGEVVALMDTDVLVAQRRQAEAQLQQAQSAVAAAESLIAQRESDRAAAQAVVAQREVELKAARTHVDRSTALASEGFISPQVVDDDRARADSAQAAVNAARAQAAAAASAIASARSQLENAKSSVVAARADIERFQADIDDTVLKAPRDGRVQYVVAWPGEVVSAGGRVLNMVDLSDVYMTFFLPTYAAGRVGIGDEVRLVFDAGPEYVFPASVSYVAEVAQFTPKTVETANEREKLMFRVRAQIPPELLRKYARHVKIGVPGMAYVRLDSSVPWPQYLKVRLP
jgi:HlyD family secretion protein